MARLLGIAGALHVVACSKPITEDECGQLLDHYTDKVIDQTRSKANRGERRQMILEARQKAKLDPAFSECSSRVTRAAFDCALSAQSADQIERCLL
jgi:hypothetical protein